MEESFKIDLSVFNVNELKVLVKIIKKQGLTKKEIESANKIIKENERQENEYYENAELTRRKNLKIGNNITEQRIDLLEIHSKNTLISDLLKYENRDKYIKEQKPYINRRFLDRLNNYLKLTNGEFIKKSHEEINQYKDISDLFINLIEKKVKDNYNKGLEVKKTFLPFLYLNEYMK